MSALEVRKGNGAALNALIVSAYSVKVISPEPFSLVDNEKKQLRWLWRLVLCSETAARSQTTMSPQDAECD